MFLPLRVHIRAQRHDLDLLAPRIRNKPSHQCRADAAPAHCVRHTRVIGDDQRVIDDGEGEFGFFRDTVDDGFVAGPLSRNVPRRFQAALPRSL